MLISWHVSSQWSMINDYCLHLAATSFLLTYILKSISTKSVTSGQHSFQGSVRDVVPHVDCYHLHLCELETRPMWWLLPSVFVWIETRPMWSPNAVVALKTEVALPNFCGAATIPRRHQKVIDCQRSEENSGDWFDWQLAPRNQHRGCLITRWIVGLTIWSLGGRNKWPIGRWRTHFN